MPDRVRDLRHGYRFLIMADTCDPATLVESAKCFVCLEPPQREAIKTYLLAVLAGGSLDPETLMEDAKCFMCIQPNQHKAMQNYLLCQILNL